MRLCKTCKKDISDRHYNAVYCRECAKKITEIKKQKHKKRMAEMRKAAKRAEQIKDTGRSTMPKLYEDVKAATQMGMTYGQYVAWKGR